MPSHAKHGGFQVFFVARKINECDHFGALLADSHPVQVSVVGFIDDLPSGIKAEDVIPDRGGPTGFGLVFVSEKFLSGKPSTIVQLSVSQDAEEGGFTSIDIAYICIN